MHYIPSEGESRKITFASNFTTRKGDIIRVVSGKGGGLGDPRERDPELVRQDLKNGLITKERALEIYGVESE